MALHGVQLFSLNALLLACELTSDAAQLWGLLLFHEVAQPPQRQDGDAKPPHSLQAGVDRLRAKVLSLCGEASHNLCDRLHGTQAQ